ncbi:MAG: hypothetical protein IJY90_00300 [Clostridia bacterium]|nr:hypothetical protein [Clostridia bacterium]
MAGIFLFVGSEVVHADNSSTQQTVYLQQLFGADAEYRQPNYGRLKHNNGEAIYISLEEGAFSQAQTETIISSLDYIFGLIGDINDNYHYEIVDDVNKSNYSGKSSIEFSSCQLENANGCAVRDGSIFAFGSKGKFNIDCKVKFDEDLLAKNSNHLYYTSLHELLHIFGLDDVYGNKVRHLDTYMNINTNDQLKMISPNDYKLLVACYAEDYSSFSKEDKLAYISMLQQKVEDYSKEYYSYYSQQRLNARKQGWLDCGYSIETVHQIFNYDGIVGDVALTFDVCLTTGGEMVKVLVENGQYNLLTYDSNNNMIEMCFGKAYNVNGEIYLESVHLDSFKYGKETYADMYIYLPENDTMQQYRLYDTLNNCYSANGVLG